jgi:creatinine amidohydrolase
MNILKLASFFGMMGLVLIAPYGAPQSGGKPAGPPASASLDAGYSVFQETLADMPWPEVEKAAKDGASVLLSAAVIEEHGPHMPCGTDAYLGQVLAKLTRRELAAKRVPAVVAPPFTWGVNSATHVFPGSFAIRPETAKALLSDIFASLKAMGFKRVFVINAHGDGQHRKALIEAILDGKKQAGLDIRFLVSADDVRRSGLAGEPPDWVLLHEMPADESPKSPYLDIHAGAGETGIAAAFIPDLVDLKLVRTLPPTNLAPARVGEWLKDARKVTPLGYVGDPAKYDTERARKGIQDWCRMMAEAIANYVGGKK